jgi:hypothetical protein
MGTPDSRYVSNNDYGRRLYVDDGNYSDQMGVGSRRPAFTQNTALYKQSEFKKPYREDSYEEMEYGADAGSGLPPPWPGPPSDNPAPYEGDVPIPPWNVSFLCFANPCYSWKPDEMHCEPISCMWPIQGYEILSAPAGCDYVLSLTELCAHCPEGETFQILFNVKMRAQFQHGGATVTVDGRYYGMSMSHCFEPEEEIPVECGDDTGISWDDDTSAETIARETSVTVAIKNSNETGHPYSWSVSGVGFTLDEAETTGLTNTLNADDTACGTATITVMGCGSTVVTGYVRCTEGIWGNRTRYGAPCAGGGNQVGCTEAQFDGGVVIENKWRLFQIQWCLHTLSNCSQCIGNCSDNCAAGNISVCPKCTSQAFSKQCLVNFVDEDEWICT